MTCNKILLSRRRPQREFPFSETAAAAAVAALVMKLALTSIRLIEGMILKLIKLRMVS